MTNMPEAKLAREAELCYASVAMVTDYDSWHPDHGEVDVAEIIAILTGNADKARVHGGALARGFWAEPGRPAPMAATGRWTYAILTAEAKRDPAMMEKLSAVAGRVGTSFWRSARRAGTCWPRPGG
jgi:5'-methylthioadenosine phosphorylase